MHYVHGQLKRLDPSCKAPGIQGHMRIEACLQATHHLQGRARSPDIHLPQQWRWSLLHDQPPLPTSGDLTQCLYRCDQCGVVSKEAHEDEAMTGMCSPPGTQFPLSYCLL